MVVHLFSAFLAGFLLHRTKPFFERFGDNLSFLARCAAGVSCMYPFDAALFAELEYISDLRKRHFVAFCLAAFIYGSGVIVGYLMDGDE